MALAPDTIAAIARRLAERAGLELPAWVIDARATARIAALGVSADEYVALIDGSIDNARGAGELTALIEAVRVGESRLFRHRAQIDVLARVVAPALRAQGRRAIRVWSAGCAAGEEPYTLALVLSRALPGCAISIVATDVSSDALARARTASYPRAALDHVPEHYRDGFVVDGEWVRVADEVTALVRFEQANLLEGTAPRGCDVVWCRNVLIYFTAEARRRAIDRLVGALVRDGVVFVGYSESLRDVEGLEARTAGDAVYYVRRGEPATRPRPPTPPVPVSLPAAVTERRATGDAPANRTPPPVRLTARETLALHGQPTAAGVIAEISARLALPGLEALTIDLDGAELLDDELARVLRRARSAAGAAGVALDLRALRPGTRRWLARHGLDEEVA